MSRTTTHSYHEGNFLETGFGKIGFDSAEIMNNLELFFRVHDIPEKLQNQIITQMLESAYA